MNARPRKVETIVLGRGLAATALAERLTCRGGRVALLVEEPGWEAGVRPASLGWHPEEEQAALAAEGAALLATWQAAGVPGIARSEKSRGAAFWLLDYGELLPALGERIAAAGGSWCAVGTRVRGVSVIERAVLGAIADDARYDARRVVNAAEDERFAAFARMMRQPHALDLVPVAPSSEELAPSAMALLRDRGLPVAEASHIKGAWHVRGVAGWPLLALGVAARLAHEMGGVMKPASFPGMDP